MEGVEVDALLDTGSPASIVSLDFIIIALAKTKPKEQTNAQWKTEVRQRMEKPTISLHSYGAIPLHMVGQIQVPVSREGFQVQALVQV